MKINILTFSFSVALSILSVGCSLSAQKETSVQKSEVKEVIYQFSAGRGGKVGITVTSDSIKTESWGRLADRYPSTRNKLSSTDWKKLQSHIDWKSFTSIKSTPTRATYDGPDERLIFVGWDGKEITILNPEPSPSDAQLDSIKNHLKRLVSKQ